MLVACGQTSQWLQRHELKGNQNERVSRATAILSKYCNLPGILLDAHMIEDVFDNGGGAVPGPSDSSLSGVLIIPAEDIPKWRTLFSPELTQKPIPDFITPHTPPSWWPAKDTLVKCEFYAPRKLTGRTGGFLAISPSASAIYFSTF